MSEPEREKHKARNWVDANFPSASDSRRASLIVAYGAGLDAGLAEAQGIFEAEANALHEASIAWRAKRDAWRAKNLEMASRPGGLLDMTTDQLRAFGVDCMDQLRNADELLR